jgi:hypothetical protein
MVYLRTLSAVQTVYGGVMSELEGMWKEHVAASFEVQCGRIYVRDAFLKTQHN